MASSLKLPLLLLVLLHAILLLSRPVHCDGEDENLLQGINSYRQSLGLPPLAKHDKAGCLAEEIADQFEDQPCSRTTGPSAVSGAQPQIGNYPNLLRKCDIDINTTKDGIVLPVCVPDLVPTLVLTNYTQSPYARYLNNSKYIGTGLGSEDDWMVLVLTTNSPIGRFENAADLVSKVGLSHYLMFLFSGFFIVLLN